MSDGEGSSSAPAKRPREDDDDGVPDMPPADVEDSSDEEIGPMPVPGDDGAPVKVKNSRRKKGAGSSSLCPATAQAYQRIVLPHERIYLEHLPDTDRYYKSFMHRDTVNYVAVTRYVLMHYTRCGCSSSIVQVSS